MDLCKTSYNIITQELEIDSTQQSQQCVRNWNWDQTWELNSHWSPHDLDQIVSAITPKPKPNIYMCIYVGTQRDIM